MFLDDIKLRVREALSERRWLHTMGVADAVADIADRLLPERKDELIIAALLHDVAKELSMDEQLRLIREYVPALTKEDMSTPAALHSFAAVGVIIRDFPSVASRDVLSAVKNHTLGSPDMSLFDKIVFIADYVEAGRTNASCLEVRKYLFDNLVNASKDAAVAVLNRSILMAINYTCDYLSSLGERINSRTLATRDAVASCI